jgi:transposase
MNVTTIGLDIAKNVFHLVGTDSRGKEVLKKRVRRGEVLKFFANLAGCVVGVEACGGAHYWARELDRLGHEVKLINARHVEAFRRAQKNDYNDARAIGEALVQPRMRFVAVKTEAQQDLQALHRVRKGLRQERTRWMNRARGLLAEYGVVMGKGVSVFRRRVPEVLAAGDNGLSPSFRELLHDVYARVRALDEELRVCDRRVKAASRANETCQRLDEVPGIGEIVATGLVAAVGNGRQFRRGRDLSASIGVVPRQHTTGGQVRLLGISKRGDSYLRTQLIHGARAVVQYAHRKDDPLSRWVERIRQQRGTNVAAVALANKLLRIAWVILARGERYNPQLAARA